MPHLPTPMSSQFSSSPPSWYIPAETLTDSPLATSTTGPNLGHLAHGSVAYDNAGRDHAYHNQRWTLPGYPSRYEPYAICDPISLPSSPFQPVQTPDGAFYDPFPRVVGYGAIYTDDARMKPGDGIRRQCFNCRVAETTTWRRSMINFGKLVRLTRLSSGMTFFFADAAFFQLCNRCGLFERTHGVPRPKAFPRRRRKRTRGASADQHEGVATSPFNSDGDCNFTDSSPYDASYASQFPDVFDAVDGTTTSPSQDTPWVTHDIPHVSPTHSHLSPSHGTAPERPMAYAVYHPDFPLPSTIPTTEAYTAPSWEFMSMHPN
jgi:hypothetical protein